MEAVRQKEDESGLLVETLYGLEEGRKGSLEGEAIVPTGLLLGWARRAGVLFRFPEADPEAKFCEPKQH